MGGRGESLSVSMDAGTDLCAVSLTVGRRGPSDCSFGNHVGGFHVHLCSRGTVMSQLVLAAAVHVLKQNRVLLRRHFLSPLPSVAFEVLFGERSALSIFPFQAVVLRLNKDFTLYFHFSNCKSY